MAATRAKNIQTSVLAALAVVAIVSAAAFWYGRDSDKPSLDPAFGVELATRVRPLVEEQMSMNWLSSARGMACAVQPVGTEPAAADAVTDVEIVYVWASCDARKVQRSGEMAPIAVHLKPATRVEIPTSADMTSGRVNDMFPDRLHVELLGPRSDELNAALETALNARIRELA